MTLYLVFEAIKEGQRKTVIMLATRIRPMLIFMKFLIIKLSLWTILYLS